MNSQNFFKNIGIEIINYANSFMQFIDLDDIFKGLAFSETNFHKIVIDHWKELNLMPYMLFCTLRMLQKVTWESPWPEWIDEEEETKYPFVILPKY